MICPTATISSVELPKFVAARAVDRNPKNTRWASKGLGANGALEEQWLQLDMGKLCFIESMNLMWQAAYS
jgi:hypothetical protein